MRRGKHKPDETSPFACDEKGSILTQVIDKSIVRAAAIIFSAVLLVVSIAPSANSQQAVDFFKKNCTSCHWIGGGRLIGPDLKNVTARKDRDWLVRFMLNPNAMFDAQDPYALKLRAEAKGAIMIQVPGINAKMANALLDMIEAESKLDSSQFAGKPVTTRPYSEVDVAAGRDIFKGRTPLKNNGRACISCHTVNDIGASLGGRLGPELNTAFTRLQGRSAMTAWLSAPPTPTMRSIFQNRPLEENEIESLVAYFESATTTTKHNYDTFIVWMTVILCGIGGCFIALVAFSGIWGNRLRAVRRPLVRASKLRGTI